MGCVQTHPTPSDASVLRDLAHPSTHAPRRAGDGSYCHAKRLPPEMLSHSLTMCPDISSLAAARAQMYATCLGAGVPRLSMPNLTLEIGVR